MGAMPVVGVIFAAEGIYRYRCPPRSLAAARPAPATGLGTAPGRRPGQRRWGICEWWQRPARDASRLGYSHPGRERHFR